MLVTCHHFWGSRSFAWRAVTGRAKKTFATRFHITTLKLSDVRVYSCALCIHVVGPPPIIYFIKAPPFFLFLIFPGLELILTVWYASSEIFWQIGLNIKNKEFGILKAPNYFLDHAYFSSRFDCTSSWAVKVLFRCKFITGILIFVPSQVWRNGVLDVTAICPRLSLRQREKDRNYWCTKG